MTGVGGGKYSLSRHLIITPSSQSFLCTTSKRPVRDSKSDMMDRQALFEKFLNLLQTAPTPPEYLEAEPESRRFDYQMVAEWIALRHELKQQGSCYRRAKILYSRRLKRYRPKEHLQQQLKVNQKQKGGSG